ncbi:MAG: HAD family hydrolase [Nanoarchaeota archaeon]|nr:HAD family hydrolase [Nanoarchaeota archaeon]
MKKKIKAVIFDIDGSLIDSQAAVYYLFKDALRKFEEDGQTKKSEILELTGSSSKVWIKKLAPKIKKDKLEKMRRWVVFQYAENYLRKHATPMSYSTQVLKELKKNKIKLAIATNQTKKQAIVSLKVIKFDKFNTIVTADKVKNPKPDPEMLKLVLKRLRIKKDEIIFVGDSDSDVKAGKAIGIKTYILEHSYNKNLKANKIKSLKEVLKIVLY